MFILEPSISASPSSSQSSFTAAPATEYVNYTVPDRTRLPEAVAASLARLEAEWRDGDLTRRGYLKRQSQLLGPYSHQLVVNGSVTFEGGGKGVGQVGGANRQLLSLSEEKSLQRDVSQFGAAWEQQYGPWVSV